MKEQGVSDGRNDTIDALRIVAMFCVVTAHASYAEVPTLLETLVHLFALWTYPFFFLVTGYYLGRSDRNLCSKAPHQIARSVWLLFLSSMLFAPYILAREGLFAGAKNMATFSALCNGTYYHLWFLGSMITGILVVYSAYYLGLQACLWPISVVLVCFGLCARSYSLLGSEHYVFARHLLSIPFIYIGVYLAGRRTLRGPRAAVFVIVIGTAVQFLEAYLLRVFLDKDPMTHLFLLGTTPCAVGLLILGLNVPRKRWPRLAKWGREYTLGIYIIHPLWIPVARRMMEHLPYYDYTRRALVVPVFVASVMSVIVLERFLPSMKRAMDGRFVGLQRATG